MHLPKPPGVRVRPLGAPMADEASRPGSSPEPGDGRPERLAQAGRLGEAAGAGAPPSGAQVQPGVLKRTARRLQSDQVQFGLAAVLLLGPFAVLTAVVLTAAPGVPGVDATLAADLHRLVLPRPGLAEALRVIGVITLPWCLRALALVGAVALWRRGRRRAVIWLGFTMTAGGILSVALKVLIRRDRPPWADPIAVASGYSYPSGHALNSMVAAACLIALLRPGLRRSSRPAPAASRRTGLTRPATTPLTRTSPSPPATTPPTGISLGRPTTTPPATTPPTRTSRGRPTRRGVGGLAGAAVLLIGFDRVALGVHYLTDVLAGWSVGLAVVLLALALADPRPAGTPLSGPATEPEPDIP
jgi:membrane-associated phospholipid phosphatase